MNQHRRAKSNLKETEHAHEAAVEKMPMELPVNVSCKLHNTKIAQKQDYGMGEVKSRLG